MIKPFISALKYLCLCFVSPIFILPSFGQNSNLGLPPVYPFSKSTYSAGTQNWAITQDKKGRLFFANNEGLLCYDGQHWQLFPVKNFTVVRAVLATDDGKVFCGAQGEFGYFESEQNGQLNYHSLSDSLNIQFADVWDVEAYQNSLFFRTDHCVFEYKIGRPTIQHLSDEITTGLFSTTQGLFLQKKEGDMWHFSKGKFEKEAKQKLPKNCTASVQWLGDTLLFTTLKDGIYFKTANEIAPWKTEIDKKIKDCRIYSACSLQNGHLALGTSLDGLIIIDNSRRYFRHLDKHNGLQNNNILSSFTDRSGRLWLGLNKGIDCVDIASHFTKIIPDGALEGVGYAALVSNGRLYLGVSSGTYSVQWQPYFVPKSNSLFAKIEQTDGQVWNLQELDQQVILSHHEGAFILESQKATKLSSALGAWKFLALDDLHILCGTYNGLILYKKKGNAWVETHKFHELKESCRILVKDEYDNIWISHPYRGVYRVNWSAQQPNKINVRYYDDKNGLPSKLNNYVFSITNKAVVGTENGVYRYNIRTDRFESDSLFNKWLGGKKRVNYLQEDKSGHIWFVQDKTVGRLKVTDLGLKKEVTKEIYPELSGKLVGGFEMLYPYDEKNLFFGVEQGFLYFQSDNQHTDSTAFNLVFHSIWLDEDKDSLLFGGFDSTVQSDKVELSAYQNNLRFSFSATEPSENAGLLYRYKLEGLDVDWSDWNTTSERSYTTLPSGNYSFMAQAKNSRNQISNTISFDFRIYPPWYASIVAFICYCGMCLLFAYAFWKKQQQKHEIEKAALKKAHLLKEKEHVEAFEQSQQQLMQLENEKLEVEIQFKNQELAQTTMHLVQKGEMIGSIRERLDHILEKSTNQAVKKEVQQLVNLLNFDSKLDEDWEQFAINFDKVHVDFLKRLREKHPQISTHDQKLCAYLRINLSTKEIAPLMNISVRGVESSRYRLRKKLELPNDENLNEYMNVV